MIEPIFYSNFFIFTGGPYSGKSAVLNELVQRGYLIVPKIVPPIIQKQHVIAGNAGPTVNRRNLLDLLLEQSIADFQKMQSEKTAIFFDRGIPDLYSYSRACGMEVNKKTNDAIARFRYNQTVFLFPPWEDIYKKDQELQQDFAEALKTYAALKAAYHHCGYILVEIPKISVQMRADFILQALTHISLTNLKNDINTLLGFHGETPRINNGPCGIFAKLFSDAWNSRFNEKAHIVFVMLASKEGCWHITVRLPSGALYDGGVGIHYEENYSPGYIIEEMLEYDHARLEKWSHGLDREYPLFCPKFDKEAVGSLIEHHLDCICVKKL